MSDHIHFKRSLSKKAVPFFLAIMVVVCWGFLTYLAILSLNHFINFVKGFF